MSDELHRPLGQGPREKPRALIPPWGRIAIGAGAVLLIGGALLAPQDPLGWTLGGRPYAVARI